MNQQSFADWLLDLGYDCDELIDVVDYAKSKKVLELFMCWHKGISPDLYTFYDDDIRSQNAFK